MKVWVITVTSIPMAADITVCASRETAERLIEEDGAKKLLQPNGKMTDFWRKNEYDSFIEEYEVEE